MSGTRVTTSVGLLSILIGALVVAQRPTTAPSQPATRGSTQPVLEAVELRWQAYLARDEFRATISSDGLLRSVHTANKRYGPNDGDPKDERIEIREGRLTREQMSELAKMFADWRSLAGQYGGNADDNQIRIRYGKDEVSGGSVTPKRAWGGLGKYIRASLKLPRRCRSSSRDTVNCRTPATTSAPRRRDVRNAGPSQCRMQNDECRMLRCGYAVMPSDRSRQRSTSRINAGLIVLASGPRGSRDLCR
jgi:hypothetical protein